MSTAFYRFGRGFCNFTKFQCIREVCIHRERLNLPGGCVLACTHISHLEPFVIGSVVPRTVRWMARIEFYQSWWGAFALHRGGAFPVDRFGFTLPAARRAIELARAGEVVGLFPEGGVATGKDSVLRDGPIKLGACTIALRAQVPIIPVVVLGTEKLNRVSPWVPPRRGRVYIAFGEPIAPPARAPRNAARNRAQRFELAGRLRAGFHATFRELLAHTGLTERDVP